MENASEQTITFFFDDSGVLHKNEQSGYFVYAGFVFVDRATQNDARRKYIHANKELKKSLGRKNELKAAGLKPKHKRALLNPLKEYEKIAVVVDIAEVYEHIIQNKKARCRFKDYALKRCVKRKIRELINSGKLNKDAPLRIRLYIDEQLTGTDGYYDLRDSISEELEHGVVGFDYSRRIAKTINAKVQVEITYCDSAKNYLIQASDILANRIWTSYRTNNPELRDLPALSILTLP